MQPCRPSTTAATTPTLESWVGSLAPLAWWLQFRCMWPASTSLAPPAAGACSRSLASHVSMGHIPIPVRICRCCSTCCARSPSQSWPARCRQASLHFMRLSAPACPVPPGRRAWHAPHSRVRRCCLGLRRIPSPWRNSSAAAVDPVQLPFSPSTGRALRPRGPAVPLGGRHLAERAGQHRRCRGMALALLDPSQSQQASMHAHAWSCPCAWAAACLPLPAPLERRHRRQPPAVAVPFCMPYNSIPTECFPPLQMWRSSSPALFEPGLAC